MDSIGGNIDAFTTREYTCYSAKVLDEHLPIATDILSDILLYSVFDPVEIERERQVILEEIKMIDDSPGDHLYDVLYEKILANHSLGRPIQGFPETVKKISRQNILKYMEEFYISNNIIISVAGNIDFPAVMDLLEKHFISFKNSDEISCNPIQEIKSGVISKFRKLEQVHFCLATLGTKNNDEQRYEAYLLNTILGGSMSSRLFQKIREEKGLAYSIYSSNSPYYDTGIFSVYAATGIENYTTALELIIEELKNIKTTKVDEKELEKAKNQLKGLLMLSLESSGSRMVRLAKEEMCFGKHFTLDEIISSIDAVTAEGINNLANKLFNSQYFHFALLGPIKESKITENMLHC